MSVTSDGTRLVRRPDDEAQSVRHRIGLYDDITLPLRAYYAAQGILMTVDAEGDADEVFQRLVYAVRPSMGGLKNAWLGV